MIQVDISIMGQIYKLACKEGEESALREAAKMLDKKMSAIRDAGKIPVERDALYNVVQVYN